MEHLNGRILNRSKIRSLPFEGSLSQKASGGSFHLELERSRAKTFLSFVLQTEISSSLFSFKFYTRMQTCLASYMPRPCLLLFLVVHLCSGCNQRIGQSAD